MLSDLGVLTDRLRVVENECMHEFMLFRRGICSRCHGFYIIGVGPEVASQYIAVYDVFEHVSRDYLCDVP